MHMVHMEAVQNWKLVNLISPLLTVEGHAGFDDNLEIPEKHYAADFLIGGEFAWGLGDGKQFSLAAFIGPTLQEVVQSISMEKSMHMQRKRGTSTRRAKLIQLVKELISKLSLRLIISTQINSIFKHIGTPTTSQVMSWNSMPMKMNGKSLNQKVLKMCWEPRSTMRLVMATLTLV